MRKTLALVGSLIAVLALFLALGTGSAAAQGTLYSRLGGAPAISAVVDDFVANVAGDARINQFFAKTDIPRLKRLLNEQLCAGTGGGCTYTGRTMKEAHRGMGVSDAHFNALVEDLVKSLNKFNVPAALQNELLGVLGPMKADIVEVTMPAAMPTTGDSPMTTVTLTLAAGMALLLAGFALRKRLVA